MNREAVGRCRVLDWRTSSSRGTQRIVHVRPVEMDGLLRTNSRNYRRIHRIHSGKTRQVSCYCYYNKLLLLLLYVIVNYYYYYQYYVITTVITMYISTAILIIYYF